VQKLLNGCFKKVHPRVHITNFVFEGKKKTVLNDVKHTLKIYDTRPILMRHAKSVLFTYLIVTNLPIITRLDA
jgi:hypothetical protein